MLPPSLGDDEVLEVTGMDAEAMTTAAIYNLVDGNYQQLVTPTIQEGPLRHTRQTVRAGGPFL